jgi:hypothetical protein
LFEPPLLGAATFVPLFPLFGFSLAALVERADPQQPRPWTRKRQLVVGGAVLAGAAVFARSLATLA